MNKKISSFAYNFVCNIKFMRQSVWLGVFCNAKKYYTPHSSTNQFLIPEEK